MRRPPPIEPLPYYGYLGAIPGSFHVWATPVPPSVPEQRGLRVGQSPGSRTVDMSYRASWESSRHYLSSALIERWALTPIGEDERGEPLYRVYASTRGTSGPLREEELVCAACDRLAAEEMVVGRPSRLGALLQRTDRLADDSD